MNAWIWDVFHRETPNQLLLLRRTVRAPTPLVAGSITIAARGSFRIWVDGRFVSHHDIQSAAPGADAIDVDLTPALDGDTVTLMIGVHLLGVGTHHQPRAYGGLLVHGALTDTAGARHTLDTDEQWEVAVPPGWRQNTQQASWTTGFTEWSDRTLDDTLLGWGGAVPYPDTDRPVRYDRSVREHTVDLEPHRCEEGGIPRTAWASRTIDAPDHATALVAAGALRAQSNAEADACDYVLYRLPHQHVGFLTITVDAAARTTIDVVMGETVDEHGWPTATRQTISAVDTVTVPAGRTVHRFWNRRSFRALAVVTRGGGRVTVSAAFAAVSAERPAPVYTTDVERDARMHEVSLATTAVGRQDFYEDCPLREGGHYVADARIQAAFDLATTGVSDLSRRSLRQFAASQDPDGMVAALTPSGTHHRIPDFALQWVCQLDEHIRLADDDALLAELAPVVARTMDWADGRWRRGRFDDGEPGWWSFIDWYGFTPDARQAAMDAQYAAALRAACSLAERGPAVSPDRAARYRARLDEVLASLRPRLHHPHAAAILACALDAPIARNLVDPAVFADFRPETGYFMFWFCRALIVLGKAGEARRHLDEYWGGMLDAGAGTWWERWEPHRGADPEDDVSLCHPWSAGPILLLPMLALGVDPLARDPEQGRFEPVPSGAHTSAALHTPWGDVRSA